MSVAESVMRAVWSETAVEERALLRQDIRNRLVQLKKLTELGVTGGLSESLEDVNRKIERYNELSEAAPPASMVTKDTFVAHISNWE